jgi:hypothetical protein
MNMHLTSAQNFHHLNQPSHRGTPYLGHTSKSSTPFSYGDSLSRSGTAEPQGGTPHDSFQQLYPAQGNHNQPIMTQTNIWQSGLSQMDYGHDNGSSLHTTVSWLIAENQRLSNMTDELFVTNKRLMEQLRVTQGIVESLKTDFLEFSSKFRSESKSSKKTATKNLSNEHSKLKVRNLLSFH